MSDQNKTNHGDEIGAAPDRGSAGDVSRRGHSTTDVHAQGAGDHPDTHAAAAGGHGGHGADDAAAAEVSTLVPTTWKQLILPVLIIVLVAILIAGPVSRAFQSQPAPAPVPSATPAPAGQVNPAVAGTHEGAAIGKSIVTARQATGVQAPPARPAATATLLQVAAQPQATTPPAGPDVQATQTAVSADGEAGIVSREPVQLELDGATFVVKAGDNLLPDWRPPEDQGIATWIDGTYANQILYVPYGEQNASLFQSVKPGDTLKLTMNTGQVFYFTVKSSRRALNGPSTQSGQYTVSIAMAQDHAGVTLFLVGDPAQDRAVVEADFTGNIQ